MTDRNDLEAIGFEVVGQWELRAGEPTCVLHRLDDVAPALYAFAIGQGVKYVGKTVRPLRQRLYGYEKASGTQSTNIYVRGEISRTLQEGQNVEILAFYDPSPACLGRFTLNLPAALEDDIIRKINPPWSGRHRRQRARAVPMRDQVRSRPEAHPSQSPTTTGTSEPKDHPAEFEVIVGKAYFGQGFFNVPKQHSHRFPEDGAFINIHLPAIETPVRARVNRKANTNSTPRIMGSVGLRDWFSETLQIGDVVRIHVVESHRIEVTAV